MNEETQGRPRHRTSWCCPAAWLPPILMVEASSTKETSVVESTDPRDGAPGVIAFPWTVHWQHAAMSSFAWPAACRAEQSSADHQNVSLLSQHSLQLPSCCTF